VADQDEREPDPESIEHASANRGGEVVVEPPSLFHPVGTCLLAGLAAGLLAFALGELGYGFYQAERVPTESRYGGKQVVSTPETERKADVQNAALAFAGLGAALGLCLGAAGGLIRRSTARAAVGGVLGLIVGGAMGGGLPYVTFPSYFWAVAQFVTERTLIGLGLHALVWGLIGGAAGLAFGLAYGSPGRMLSCFVLGIVGAALGAGLFEVVGLFFYPESQTDVPLAGIWQARLLARVLVSIGAAAAIGLSFPGGRRAAAA
jgi:hypothetical protein